MVRRGGDLLNMAKYFTRNYILVSECINCLSGYAKDERLFHREFIGADLSNCASQVIFIDDPCLEPNN